MQIRIAGIVDESIVDGPGFRLTVFTQGCPHNCIGCHNPQTHDGSVGILIDTDQIIQKFTKNPMLDGITLSGGEPFIQPEPCIQLAQAAKEMGFTVWVYSGYTFEDVYQGSKTNPHWHLLLHACDMLVDGPYIQSQRTISLPFRGSKNQRVINLEQSLLLGKAIEA